MKVHSIVSLFFVACIVSCNTGNKYEDETNFTWDDFEKQKELQSKVFLSDDIVFKPTDLKVFDDFLIIKDYGGENGIFRIFDLKTKKLVGERICKGNGPSEMLSPQFAKSPKDKIAIWDMQKLLLYKYEIMEFVTNNSPIPTEITELKKDIYVNIGTADSNILEQIYDKEFLMCKYDTKTRLNKKFAKFPSLVHNDLNAVIKRDAYYINFTSNNRSVVAVCYCMTDLIDLYDIDGHLIKRIHGPEQFVPYFKTTESKTIESAFPIEEKCRDAYFVPRNHGDYFTVMYNGRYLNEENHSSSSDKIFSFSWEGNPLICYNLDKKIVSYDFDTNNKKIYAITIDPEYMIVEYDYQ